MSGPGNAGAPDVSRETWSADADTPIGAEAERAVRHLARLFEAELSFVDGMPDVPEAP